MHAGWINPGGYAFREWVGEEQVPAFGGSGDPRFGFIVVPVNTATSGRSLIRYIESIAAFRQADDEVPAEAGQIRPFYQEPRGRRVAHGPSVVEYLSRHGVVVDALRIWRQDRRMNPGCSIGKNKFIDMGVVDAHGALIELYEVKTSTARSAARRSRRYERFAAVRRGSTTSGSSFPSKPWAPR